MFSRICVMDKLRRAQLLFHLLSTISPSNTSFIDSKVTFSTFHTLCPLFYRHFYLRLRFFTMDYSETNRILLSILNGNTMFHKWLRIDAVRFLSIEVGSLEFQNGRTDGLSQVTTWFLGQRNHLKSLPIHETTHDRVEGSLHVLLDILRQVHTSRRQLNAFASRLLVCLQGSRWESTPRTLFLTPIRTNCQPEGRAYLHQTPPSLPPFAAFAFFAWTYRSTSIHKMYCLAAFFWTSYSSIVLPLEVETLTSSGASSLSSLSSSAI